MFLRKLGASGKWTFDIIYSCLQKSLRRGDIELSLEMAYEFKDFPNALKTRLIQNCSEDCPDLYLINDIFNTKSELKSLIPFIPVICTHMKSRDGLYGLRVVCEEIEWCFDIPTTTKDHLELKSKRLDLLHLLRILWTHICEHRELEYISYFQPLFPNIKLSKIYNSINKHITFLTMLPSFLELPYLHSTYTLDNTIYNENYTFSYDTLPDYVYDKHVHSAPASQRTYEFFIKNCIIHPRMPETEIEKRAKHLYITTNRGVGKSIHPVIREKHSHISTLSLIQTQLLTAKHKKRTWFCSEGHGYNYIIKGPYDNATELHSILFSDKLKNMLLTQRYNSWHFVIDGGLQQPEMTGVYYKQNCFIPIDPTKTITKSSKLETNVIIYDGDEYHYEHSYLQNFTVKEQRNLLEVLAFRKIIGTNDTCTRNIIYNKGQLYTIDDPVLYNTTPNIFKTPVPRSHLQLYRDTLNNNWEYIEQTLLDWYIEINKAVIDEKTRSFMQKQMETLLKPDSWNF